LILFPKYKALITPRAISFGLGEEQFVIDASNFHYLQGIIKEVFCLASSDEKTFNPKGKKATEIAQKLMKAR
jgi:hypothetical protein